MSKKRMRPRRPDWLSTTVFYEIYPQSFYDTNSDGIGDIPGIIRKLDYIQSLGCNAIWVNPCFESPFKDAGYDVADYYKVAKRYGTNSDLKRLFKEAQKREIRVCLDLVPGHTSIEHPWFKKSCKAGKNKYSNWYIWTDNVWKSITGQYRVIHGYGERDGNFITNFFWSQPALNYGFAKPDPARPWKLSVNHPDVRALRKEIINIMRYWLDMGASGFRVDMAYSLVKDDEDRKQTSRFWRQVRSMFDKDYPEAVLISEWSCPSVSINAGFHIDFMIHFNDAAYSSLFRMEKQRDAFGLCEGHSFFSKDGKGDITKFLGSYLKHLNNTKHKGYISIPSGNHDISRISFGHTNKEIEVAFAFILTMPGVPFIYYGDEIGMKYLKYLPSKEGGYGRTGSRTPMQWSNGKSAGFSKAAANKLYLPVDKSKNRPNVKKQQNEPNSLLNKVRRFVALRKSSAALCADGEFIPLYAKPRKYPFVYMRRKGREKFLITLNPSSNKVSANFKAPSISSPGRLQVGTGTVLTAKDGRSKVDMAPVSYGIFRM